MKSIFRIATAATLITSSVLAADKIVTEFPPVKDEFIPKIDAALPTEAVVKPKSPRKILLFSRTEGFSHGSIPCGIYTITKMGEKTGAYSVVQSGDMEMFSPDKLKEFDAVFFNNTTGLKFNEEQRKALLDFVRGGKAMIGIHSATDNFPNWDEGQACIGGKFDGHPWGAGDTVAVKIDDPANVLNKPFGGQGFWIKDEIYQMDKHYKRDDRRVLMSLDMSKPQNARGPKKEGEKSPIHREDNDFGIAWIRKEGAGRVFYSSLGHNNEVFWTPQVLEHWLAGIQYALGDLDADATPLAEYKPALAPDEVKVLQRPDTAK
ncbi:MAG: ThuA domain-containing protein [Verrucomicrobiales bacterium]|jgi:type 1 glutamine amidotransferase|nr:ThuA domain-containing protein [Verrucomicrobiales bacterium]